jgi:hypothetical protein
MLPAHTIRPQGDRGDRTFGFFSVRRHRTYPRDRQTSVAWVTSAKGVPGGAGESVTQRFGNPTIGKQRKSKQFKSARVVKTLPRTGVLLPTFLTSARWRTAHPRFCRFCRTPAAPDDWTRPGLFAPLVRVALDQPERRLHHDPDRGAEDLLHSRPSPLTVDFLAQQPAIMRAPSWPASASGTSSSAGARSTPKMA